MPTAQQFRHAPVYRRPVFGVYVEDRSGRIASRDRARLRNPGRRVSLEIARPEIPVLAVDHSEQKVASRLVDVGERRIEVVKVRFRKSVV